MIHQMPLPSVFNYNEENRRNKTALYDSICVLRHTMFLLLLKTFNVPLPPNLNPAPDAVHLVNPDSNKYGFNFTTGNTSKDWRLDCTVAPDGKISFCLLQYVEKESRWVWLYPNGLRPSGEGANEQENNFMSIEEFQLNLPLISSVMKNTPSNAL